jgi:hypothetical protein
MQTRMIVIMLKKEVMAFQDPCLPYFDPHGITGIRFGKKK